MSDEIYIEVSGASAGIYGPFASVEAAVKALEEKDWRGSAEHGFDSIASEEYPEILARAFVGKLKGRVSAGDMWPAKRLPWG